MPLQKMILCLFTACLSLCSFSQVADTFHYYTDYYNKRAVEEDAIHHIRVFKAGGGWTYHKYGKFENNLLETGMVTDSSAGIKHGDFISYYNDGKKYETGRYENGKKQGEWIRWYTEGKILSASHFSKGMMSGSNKSWNDNGNILDSFMLDEKGDGMGYGFYPSGLKKYEGKFTAGLKTGDWVYFYNQPGSQRSMEINFGADTVLTKKCYTTTGSQQNICIYEREAGFTGGDRAWRNYLVAELTDSRYANHMKKLMIYRVMVRFVVAKDGTISDVKIENPGVKKLDRIAENIIRNSPPWQPAMQYNQPVNAYRRQPITFAVE
jgi:TonB family protein